MAANRLLLVQRYLVPFAVLLSSPSSSSVFSCHEGDGTQHSMCAIILFMMRRNRIIQGERCFGLFGDAIFYIYAPFGESTGT
jgi:hypothetical protein